MGFKELLEAKPVLDIFYNLFVTLLPALIAIYAVRAEHKRATKRERLNRVNERNYERLNVLLEEIYSIKLNFALLFSQKKLWLIEIKTLEEVGDIEEYNPTEINDLESLQQEGIIDNYCLNLTTSIADLQEELLLKISNSRIKARVANKIMDLNIDSERLHDLLDTNLNKIIEYNIFKDDNISDNIRTLENDIMFISTEIDKNIDEYIDNVILEINSTT